MNQESKEKTEKIEMKFQHQQEYLAIKIYADKKDEAIYKAWNGRSGIGCRETEQKKDEGNIQR